MFFSHTRTHLAVDLPCPALWSNFPCGFLLWQKSAFAGRDSHSNEEPGTNIGVFLGKIIKEYAYELRYANLFVSKFKFSSGIAPKKKGGRPGLDSKCIKKYKIINYHFLLIVFYRKRVRKLDIQRKQENVCIY